MGRFEADTETDADAHGDADAYGRLVEMHQNRIYASVLRIVRDEGFGFIGTADGRELYFSREDVVHPDFDALEPGVTVQFIEELAAEGPQAKRVSVGRHGG